jgi:catechol 2,3-dioxygenase-like lactoylglutathione lyase family enzyme
MTARLGSAFVPVSDAAAAADWYAELFGLRVVSVDLDAAVVRDDTGRQVALLSPSSGISAKPGLNWAPCSYIVADLDGFHANSERGGLAPTAIDGDASICRFFTLRDPDGNTILIVDR